MIAPSLAYFHLSLKPALYNTYDEVLYMIALYKLLHTNYTVNSAGGRSPKTGHCGIRDKLDNHYVTASFN